MVISAILKHFCFHLSKGQAGHLLNYLNHENSVPFLTGTLSIATQGLHLERHTTFSYLHVAAHHQICVRENNCKRSNFASFFFKIVIFHIL